MHMHSGVKITVDEQNVQRPNVLPNGGDIGQLQKQVSTKLNNHAPDGEKLSEF